MPSRGPGSHLKSSSAQLACRPIYERIGIYVMMEDRRERVHIIKCKCYWKLFMVARNIVVHPNMPIPSPENFEASGT